MNDPEPFILTTDFATIKNDGSNNSLSVTIPGSLSVPGSSMYILSDVVSVGSVSSNIRSQIRSSKDGRWISSQIVQFVRLDSLSRTYSIAVELVRESSTTVRLTAIVLNPYPSTLIGASGSETFNAEVRTFLSPFV